MRLACLLIVASAIVSAGCRAARKDSSHAASDAGVFLPETIGALSLEHVEAFASEFRDAASAAAARIEQDGKNPALSFAQVAKHSDDELVVHIWPAPMFGGRRPMGGGGRSLYYSRSAGRIVRGEAWQ
jgi:hypothetical protein